MRLLGRHDKPLAVGLVVGTLIVFERPLRFLLDVARDIEAKYQVDLVPALTVLCGVYVFHQYRIWQDAKAEAAAAAADARQAQERSRELERLVSFGRALAKALDMSALQQVLWQRLPQFVQERAVWVLMYGSGTWEPLVQEIGPHPRETADKLADLATRALATASEDEAHAEGDILDGHLCFPMLVGERPVGVLGIMQGREALTAVERRGLGAAAALLAIAVRNVRWFQENRNNSLRDSLTGCFNRACGMEALDAQLRLARRASRPLSIIMFDIDEFKGINDRFGHLAGDALLAGLGLQLGNVLRASDIKCRYGGDEFLVILPETPLTGAEQVAEALRRQISRLRHPVDSALSISASVGVASVAEGEFDAKALLARADEALYQAKKAGRNRVAVAAQTSQVIAPRPSAPTPDSSALDDAMLDHGVVPMIPLHSRAEFSGPTARRDQDQSGTICRVLIVDDDDQLLALLERWVREAGLEAVGCRTFEDAKRSLAAHTPNVLLTDIRLDGFNGLHLVVWAADRFPAVWCVVLTAYDDPVLRKEAAELKAHYLLKPVARDELLAAIHGMDEVKSAAWCASHPEPECPQAS